MRVRSSSHATRWHPDAHPPDPGRGQAGADAGFRRLSEESQRRRFLAPKPQLSSRDLRYLTEVDGADHVALVAIACAEPRVIVGVARFVRLADDPTTAEMAIVVGDAHQRLGLGTLLARALADDALAHGVRRFSATVLAENEAVQRLIGLISERLELVGSSPGVRELVAELAA